MMAMNQGGVTYEFPMTREELSLAMGTYRIVPRPSDRASAGPLDVGACGRESIRTVWESERLVNDAPYLHLPFLDKDSGPGTLALLVARWLTPSGQQRSASDGARIVAEETSPQLFRDSVSAERWVSEVAGQGADPSAEQWARFREMGPQAQRVALSLVACARPPEATERLTRAHSLDPADTELAVKLYRVRMKELWAKMLPDDAERPGHQKTMALDRERMRTAERRAKQMGLLPPVQWRPGSTAAAENLALSYEQGVQPSSAAGSAGLSQKDPNGATLLNLPPVRLAKMKPLPGGGPGPRAAGRKSVQAEFEAKRVSQAVMSLLTHTLLDLAWTWKELGARTEGGVSAEDALCIALRRMDSLELEGKTVSGFELYLEAWHRKDNPVVVGYCRKWLKDRAAQHEVPIAVTVFDKLLSTDRSSGDPMRMRAV